jgi:hypothetical protein
LATTDDARVHCAVLKIRAVPAASALAGVASRSWSEGMPPCGRSLRTQQRARPANPLATSVPSG